MPCHRRPHRLGRQFVRVKRRTRERHALQATRNRKTRGRGGRTSISNVGACLNARLLWSKLSTGGLGVSSVRIG